MAPQEAGQYQVKVVALDQQGAVGTQRYFLDVGDVALNRAPQITSLPLTLASAGEIYTYPVEANDRDEDALSYQLLQGPPGMDVDPDTGVLSWGSAVGGSYPVAVGAFDPSGAGATQGFTLTVRVNQPPQILSVDPPTQALVGDLYRYDLRAEDPNGDELTYELVDGPEGMTLDELGRVEWIPDAAGGPIPVPTFSRSFCSILYFPSIYRTGRGLQRSSLNSSYYTFLGLVLDSDG